jgi:hypothetical protein
MVTGKTRKATRKDTVRHKEAQKLTVQTDPGPEKCKTTANEDQQRSEHVYFIKTKKLKCQLTSYFMPSSMSATATSTGARPRPVTQCTPIQVAGSSEQ